MEERMNITITLPRDAAEVAFDALRRLIGDMTKDVELVLALKAAAALKAALEETK